MPWRTRTGPALALPAGLVLALVSAQATAAGAPLIDVRAQIGQWNASPSGTVSSDGDDFDVDDELDFDKNSTTLFSASFEHPVPFLPNVRLKRVSLSDEAKSTLTRARTFGPVTFQRDEPVRSEYDISMTDATLYYSPLDNVVELDIGATVRSLDVEAEITSRRSGDSESAGGSVVVPLAHVGARANLPFSGLYASGEINALSAGGNSLRDLRAAVGWRAGVIEIEAGYQEYRFEIDDVDDLSADVDFSGPYAAIAVAF
jgi:outer membrane protein